MSQGTWLVKKEPEMEVIGPVEGPMSKKKKQLLKDKGRDTVLHSENLETREGQGDRNKKISCGYASCGSLAQNPGLWLFHTIFYKHSTPLYAVQIT